jgi:LmbE family N-acetylglucosaminyl deacetylase
MTSGLRLLARRGLHQAARLSLRLRSRPLPMREGRAVLVIAPHADDEVLGCAGLMFRKLQLGAPLHVAYLTDGSASHPAHPTLAPGTLARLRRAEAAEGLARLGAGADTPIFLDARDGTLARLGPTEAEGLVSRIAEVLSGIRPDEIFLPCRHDGSSEHDAAFALVQRALGRGGLRPRMFEYPVWSWWNPVLLLRPLRTSRRIWRIDFHGDQDRKRHALAAYVSQVQPTPPWRKPVLSREFVSFFSSDEEFFFET